MTSSYTLVEHCCGSAALTFHLLGAKRAVVPYQGSKWRYRRELAALLVELGFEGPPTRVRLTDPGPWGRVVRVLLDLPRGSRREAGSILNRWTGSDPRGVYDCLHGATPSPESASFAAEFLFLQRLAHSGKAVGTSEDGRWSSPGFNATSAYGTPGTERFGPIHAMIPALVKVLRSYEDDLIRLDADSVLTACGPASPVLREWNVVEYIDPPYQGSTRYPDGHLDRADVVNLALAGQQNGSAVLVSEALPIPELVERGWKMLCLRGGASSGTSPFKARGEEWVTYVGRSPR